MNVDCNIFKPYTGHHFGNIYGIPGVPERYDLNKISYRTQINNMYLTGADTAGHGIVGAMMSGVITTAIIKGIPRHLIKIFSRAKRYGDS
jgi:phytoene dehydrogenase-like protein